MTGESPAIPLWNAERAELRARRLDSAVPQLWDALDAVRDPELPMLSIWDLGILQDIHVGDDGVTVDIIPTWSGCPAMELIETLIVERLHDAGVSAVQVRQRAAPAWTTDAMEPAARRALQESGIAAPGDLRCPQCGSDAIDIVSEYGATACKSLCRCRACGEPFERFKAL